MGVDCCRQRTDQRNPSSTVGPGEFFKGGRKHSRGEEGSVWRHGGRTRLPVLMVLLLQCWEWPVRGGRVLGTKTSASSGKFQKCKFSGPTLLDTVEEARWSRNQTPHSESWLTQVYYTGAPRGVNTSSSEHWTKGLQRLYRQCMTSDTVAVLTVNRLV